MYSTDLARTTAAIKSPKAKRDRASRGGAVMAAVASGGHVPSVRAITDANVAMGAFCDRDDLTAIASTLASYKAIRNGALQAAALAVGDPSRLAQYLGQITTLERAIADYQARYDDANQLAGIGGDQIQAIVLCRNIVRARYIHPIHSEVLWRAVAPDYLAIMYDQAIVKYSAVAHNTNYRIASSLRGNLSVKMPWLADVPGLWDEGILYTSDINIGSVVRKLADDLAPQLKV